MPPRGVELVGLLPNSSAQLKSDAPEHRDELERDPVSSSRAAPSCSRQPVGARGAAAALHAPRRRRRALTPLHASPPTVQDILGFEGYRASLPRQVLFVALCVLTCGALFIVSRWFLRLRIALTLTRCPLAQAEWVVVTVSARPARARAPCLP